MDRIGLVEAISTLRAELTAALEQAENEKLTFPIVGMQLEFQVGITRDASARSGLRFWIVELGADTSLARQQVQRIIVTLGVPVHDGETVAVQRGSDIRP